MENIGKLGLNIQITSNHFSLHLQAMEVQEFSGDIPSLHLAICALGHCDALSIPRALGSDKSFLWTICLTAEVVVPKLILSH